MKKERNRGHAKLYEVDKITGCWNWLLSLNRFGYAQVSIKDKNTSGHRYIYLLSGRKIPKGMQLDHLCRNRKCVNPDHLEVVTQRENIRRGIVAKLSINDLFKIKELRKKGLKQNKISKMFNINQCHVSRILTSQRCIGLV